MSRSGLSAAVAMLSLRDVSVKRKLMTVIALTSCIALFLAAAAFVSFELASFDDSMARDLDTIAGIIGDNTKASLSFNDADAARDILAALRAKTHVVSAYVFTRRGEVLARYLRSGAAAETAPEWPVVVGHRVAGDRLVTCRSIELGGETIGFVCLGSDLEERAQLLRRYVATLGLVLAVSLLAALLLSSWLQRVVSGPVLRLATAARAISLEKDYSIRVAKEGNDELGLLTDAFNEMLGQIQERDRALQQAHDELERRVEERTAQLRQEVTDRQKAQEALRESEEQLRQAQKMEAIGRLAGGVAHDFNNLLTTIMGYGQLLSRRLGEDGPLRTYAEDILKAAERAASLTRQLLAFSRKQVLAPRVVDLNVIVANMDRMLRRVIGEDIELLAVGGAGLGRVNADPGQIEQVIMNLVVNARDAMPAGGRLTIEATNVDVDEVYAGSHPMMSRGPYVMLAVTDTGCGMDEATQARVFEPFFTTKELGKGTGLGLSMVYGIVKQSGGFIWVYSEVGKGTTFKIYLPRVELPAEALDESLAGEAAPRGTETILLVEDDDLVRELAKDILRDHGYGVMDAPHAREAIRLCEEHSGRIDLMLSDLVMPDLNGRKLWERVHPMRPEMKILFMSGYADRAVIHQGILDPDTPFLQKPFNPDALAAKVRLVLDSQVRPPSATGPEAIAQTAVDEAAATTIAVRG